MNRLISKEANPLPDLSKVTAILPDLADYVVYGAIAVVTLIGLFKCLIPLCIRRL